MFLTLSIVLNFKFVLKKETKLVIPTDEESAAGKVKYFDRSEVNFFIVAVFKDDTDLNVEMKVLLFHYFVTDNPYYVEKKP